MSRSAAHRPLAGAVLVGALLALSGCASTVDSIERLGRKAVERVGTPDAKPVPPAGRAAPAPGPAATPASTRAPVAGAPEGRRTTATE
ncbi:hypothetical protein [Streptomyces sp. NPDC093795]|uniref:hypothetical protein n=1 Tax=Streptomyces sp. NPDC093795 TaxID=3366051 RepID=UPI0038004EA0